MLDELRSVVALEPDAERRPELVLDLRARRAREWPELLAAIERRRELLRCGALLGTASQATNLSSEVVTSGRGAVRRSGSVGE